jgi:hypothetical protein
MAVESLRTSTQDIRFAEITQKLVDKVSSLVLSKLGILEVDASHLLNFITSPGVMPSM